MRSATGQTITLKSITLTKGQVALVDDSDFEWINRWKWQAVWNKYSRGYYAMRKETVANGKRRTVYMHRTILGLYFGDPRQGDHIDSGQTLRNTRDNLRIATPKENSRNIRKHRDNTSGFKGVSRDGKKWKAQIGADGKILYLGRRETPEAAYRELYVPAAAKYHGEFAQASTFKSAQFG